jgi:hypothetical protein
MLTDRQPNDPNAARCIRVGPIMSACQPILDFASRCGTRGTRGMQQHTDAPRRQEHLATPSFIRDHPPFLFPQSSSEFGGQWLEANCAAHLVFVVNAVLRAK